MSVRINIGSLKEGLQEIQLTSKPEELGLESGLIKTEIEISFEVFKLNNQLDLKVRLSGEMNLECDKCLDVFSKRFETDFEIVFVTKSSREWSVDDDYVRNYNPYMKYIDITRDIRESILLAIPMKKIPGENDEGTCVLCGKTKQYWKGILTSDEDYLD